MKFKKKSSNCSVEKLVDSKGNTVEDSQVIADLFNQHFSEIGLNVAQKPLSPLSNGNFTVLSFIKKISSFLFLSPITEREVLIYLGDLNLSKSSSIYEIFTKYVKMSSLIIAPVITKLYNCCLSVGTFSML